MLQFHGPVRRRIKALRTWARQFTAPLLAFAVITTMGGCALHELPAGSDPARSPAASASASGPPLPMTVGDLVDETEALLINADSDRSGMYAYKLDDGKFAIVDKTQPLPPAVQAHINQNAADTIPAPVESVNSTALLADSARDVVDATKQSTGKLSIVIYYTWSTLFDGRSSYRYRLKASGAIPDWAIAELDAGGDQSYESASAIAQRIVEAKSNPALWTIVDTQ
jgi:hypothetical protein